MPSLPSAVNLTSASGGGTIFAADHNNDGTAIQTAINALIDALNDGVAGDVLGGVGPTLTFGKPPGYEYHYSESTVDVSITGTSGAPTAVLAGSSVTFDGSTTVEIEFYCATLVKGTTNISVSLYDGAAEVGRFFFTDVAGNLPAGKASKRITPSAAAHTYNVKAYVDAGTGTLKASSLSALPMFLRITKV